MNDQTLLAIFMVVAAGAFLWLVRAARAGKLGGKFFGGEVLEHLGDVPTQEGIFATATLRLYRLAPQYDGATVGLELCWSGLASFTLISLCLRPGEVLRFAGMLALGSEPRAEPVRYGPQALTELGQVAARMEPFGSATLRVRRLALPHGGSSLGLDITLKSLLSLNKSAVWLNQEQAATLERLLARASERANG